MNIFFSIFIVILFFQLTNACENWSCKLCLDILVYVNDQKAINPDIGLNFHCFKKAFTVIF